MPPQTLDGETLGEKHRHFNKLVQDAVTNEQFQLSQINSEHGDIHNLLNIDIACRARNVQYIIEVLKCDDMLYVSRAIKRSTWLITEQTHAHIIDPEYLYTQLFPHMLTKAINKLLLHIRLHLKDERRIEAFYDYLKDDQPKEAAKWLLTCSIPFTEKVLKNRRNITLKLFKRLCKRSIIFLPYYTKVTGHYDWATLKAVLFLLKSHTEESLDVFDACKAPVPHMGKTQTKNIMKKCAKRILDNFDRYVDAIDISTVAKYMKKDEIKSFLENYGKVTKKDYFFRNYENIKPFVSNMTKEERFDFVKKLYIDKDRCTYSEGPMSSDDETSALCPYYYSQNSYIWYQYAPFDVAFSELKKLIRAESSPNERSALFLVLVSCANKQQQHLKTLIHYYFDKHRNEPFKFKIQVVNKIIEKLSICDLDTETWNILDNLFRSLDVYSTESENPVRNCVNCIVLYKVLHNENVPEVVEKKLSFGSFKKYQRKLDAEGQNKLFSYLFNTITTKIQNKVIVTELDFNETLTLLVQTLDLYNDWKKDVK
ncbi:uncharacterized protein LOC142981486 [Anticarsia gemmatalis]|uniref:uncharacterized protein LOC142981486 n=1 Tax=Anticarsia gemmatalis TaxID=129554 RepID=UPI003F7638DC